MINDAWILRKSVLRPLQTFHNHQYEQHLMPLRRSHDNIHFPFPTFPIYFFFPMITHSFQKCYYLKVAALYKSALLPLMSFDSSLPFDDTPALFNFPEDSVGIEQGRSYEHIMQLVRRKFISKFGENSEIEWTYVPCCPQSSDLETLEFVLRCRICSNVLIYRKSLNFDVVFRLVRMDRYHPHAIDQKKERELNVLIRGQKLLSIDKYQKTSQKMNRIRNQRSKIQDLQEFIRHLPHGLLNDTKAQLVLEHFGISYPEYQVKLKAIDADYDKNAVQLFEHFNEKGYECAYLPQDIVQQNQIILQNKKNEQKVILELNLNKKASERINPKHWNLPNVLLIVTPQMRQLYLRYGQYVGFDLTYSLIKETPENSKEYLVGVFGGTSQSQRIAVYGLVITNNQTVEIYKYLFKEFIRIMGREPHTIITDEEKSIYYALKELKEEGGFHGYHLFDTFHILKKFRKASGYQGDNFQLFRQLIHAKNRPEYNLLLEKMLRQVHNDAELEIIKSFDYNNSMYCISQIDQTFVGTGISDSPCEKIHDLIKQELPHQINYIKGVLIILEVVKMRNSKIKYGFIEHFAVEERFNMPFLKPYRFMLSRGVFRIMVKEVCKSATYSIKNDQQEHYSSFKIEHGAVGKKGKHRSSVEIFFVQTKLGTFTVFKEEGHFPNEYKWRCECELQQKTGVFCSHIAKILLFKGQAFYNNIHPRWFIKEEELQEKSKNYGSKVKYLYKVRKTRPGKRRMQKLLKEKEEMGESNDDKSLDNNDFDGDSTSTFTKTSQKTGQSHFQDQGSLDIDSDISSENESKYTTTPVDIEPILQIGPKKKTKQSKTTQFVPLRPSSKQRLQENPFRSSRWNKKEKQAYLIFLIKNIQMMRNEQIVDNIERYRLMSKVIKTRSRIQCQNYHKNKMDKYKSLENIILDFKLRNQDNE